MSNTQKLVLIFCAHTHNYTDIQTHTNLNYSGWIIRTTAKDLAVIIILQYKTNISFPENDKPLVIDISKILKVTCTNIKKNVQNGCFSNF